MSRIDTTREVWHPQTQQDREAVRVELLQVLASPQFSSSKRYPAMLQYIVESTLAGKSEQLKERTIGVEVFERLPTYDTNADTVVRYTAGEVRKRLSLYYHDLDRRPAIQISLPTGSYVPEFLHTLDEPAHTGSAPGHSAARAARPSGTLEVRGLHLPLLQSVAKLRRSIWIAFALLIAVAVAGGFGWRYHTTHLRTSLDDFWAPVLHDQPTVLLCTGGVVFAQNNFSGVVTAGKETDYPFVSIQIASAIAQLSELIGLNRANVQLESAASTPVTELRERPIVLLGGYNNQWTMRLLQPLPIHFSPDQVTESIIDTTQPQTSWARDHSLPYSSADDYALVARFRDTTTDNWVIVLAGLGRNGTEAAAQFVSSPHYMQLLRDHLGHDFGTKNIEVVMKLSVIEGKTGAPTILTVRTW
ncbi:MAG TPA: hypothetical protein VNU94_05235 [Acidobacteriaceae bacterium]|nr:hypothetical protein [Acidobacteriaceae bacterium]